MMRHMSHLTAAMLSFATAVSVKATIVTVIGLAVARCARRAPAAVRHVLLSAAFAVLAALPLASLIAPSIWVPLPPSMAAPLTSFRTDRFTVADTDAAVLRAARARGDAAPTAE